MISYYKREWRQDAQFIYFTSIGYVASRVKVKSVLKIIDILVFITIPSVTPDPESSTESFHAFL